jgi:hypothetical protein
MFLFELLKEKLEMMWLLAQQFWSWVLIDRKYRIFVIHFFRLENSEPEHQWGGGGLFFTYFDLDTDLDMTLF